MLLLAQCVTAYSCYVGCVVLLVQAEQRRAVVPDVGRG